MTFRCRRSGRGCGAASAITSAPMLGRTGKNDGTGCLGHGDDQDDTLPPSRPGYAERYISRCAALLVELLSSTRSLCRRRGDRIFFTRQRPHGSSGVRAQ